jgi:predicted secreted hydrolase
MTFSPLALSFEPYHHQIMSIKMEQFPKIVTFAILSLFMMAPFTDRQVFADDERDYLSVAGPCNLTFPKDHGPHAGYRIEWWYYTGNLQADSGEQYGFQLTFFRNQISAPGAEKKWPQPHSFWRTQQVYAGHAAISDISGKRHLQSELIARGSLGIADVSQQADQTTIFIKNWSAQIGPGRHILKAAADHFSLELSLLPAKAPVLHGTAGYTRKGSTPERASCYYSFTRLKSEGTLTIDGTTIRVQGFSWMDHEFSSAPLEPGIVGWDWFSLQLADQTEIMIYLLRKQGGELNAASSGTFIDKSGKRRHLTKDDFRVDIMDTWKSPHSKAVYPARWRLTIFPLSIELIITPKLSDQEMQTTASTGVTYWEGSVSVNGTAGKNPLKGMGYVELTGYAKAFSAPL